MREGLARPRLENDLELLAHALLRLLARHAEPVVVELDEAAADAELDAAVRHQIDHRELLGDLDRAVQRQHDDRRAEPRPLACAATAPRAGSAATG